MSGLEIFGAVAAAATLLEVAKRFSTRLETYDNVHRDIGALKIRVGNLALIVDEISVVLRDVRSHRHDDVTSNEVIIWKRMDAVLKLCTDRITQLDSGLGHLLSRNSRLRLSSVPPGILSRMKDLEDYLQALSMLKGLFQLILQRQQAAAQQSMHRDLIGIRVFQEGKMDEILRGINKIYDQHRPVELLQPGQPFSNENDNLSIHLKKIVDAVISIPNTEASSPRSVPRTSIGTRATSFSTDNSPDVTHVEPLRELAQRFKDQAEYDLEHCMYKDAELHHLESIKCFEELHDAYSIIFDNFHDMNMMLSRIYEKLEKYEDAKMIVQTQLAVSQPLTYHLEPGWKSLRLDTGENTDYTARTSHDMAALLLAQFRSCSGSTHLSDLDGRRTAEELLRDAEHHAKRAFRIRRNLHEKDHESCKESARLLVEIYNNSTDKQMYAETYAYLYLPIISNRQSGLDVAAAINDHTISPDDALRNVTSIDLNNITDQKPALMVAMDCPEYAQCQRCHIIADKLLRKGADRNAPLAHAVSKDQIPDCKFLLRHGADINWLDARGFTPLMLAVKKCNLEMISFLLGEQPNINARGYQGQTALHLAAQTRVDQILKLLLKTVGVDVDAIDDNGMTAMHHAAKHDNVRFAKRLGRAGADLEIKDRSTRERTPLYIAVKEDKYSFIKALLALDAQIDLEYLPKTRSSDIRNLLRNPPPPP